MCAVPNTPTSVPLPLPEEELKDLVTKTKDWAIMHGASMRSKTNFSEDTVNFAPFTLFPSTFLKKDFERIVNLQTVFHELIHNVANDDAFLRKCFKDIIRVDKFTDNLFKIYDIVQREGVAQSLCLGLVRCDYMLECNSGVDESIPKRYPDCTWKQVEFNTIASGFGWLGPISAKIHRYVLLELGLFQKISHLPENNALDGLCQGMLEAWQLFGNINAVILFIIEDKPYNISDQRFHEFRIRELNPMVKVIRRTLSEIGDRGRTNSNNDFLIDENVVAVIYFRAGYEPGHYPTGKEWYGRLLMERSTAIKCPTIQYHLAGTKKVQQELSKTGTVEKFLKNSEKVTAVRDVFVRLYGLDFDDQAIEMAIEDPERFVLKPQREGGGNNVYGANIKDAILKMKHKMDRTAWILMDKIIPPITKGYMIRPGDSNPPPISEMVSELGIYGVIIGDSQQILINRQVGHMLRTKIATENEGGVTAGSGALDSPYLLE